MVLDNVEVIVGTYEEFVLGYRLEHTDQLYSFTQSFASHVHTASVRCVTSNGKMMASGGVDETVHLFDMDKRKEIGIMMYHSGTVSCIAYSPNGSHLLSGGDDGMLAISRIGSFQVEKVWYTAHKSGIVGISVHPTGKLAMTVGADATLRTWNLVKGRQAYTTRLGSSKCGAGWQITGVRWGPNGKLYAVGIGSKVDVYSIETATIIYTVAAETKISSFCFFSDDLLCVGCESGMIYIYDVKSKCCLSEMKAHDLRIKSLATVVSENSLYLVSASSSGQIKLWKYMKKKLLELCKTDTGCRITCLTVMTCVSTYVKEEENLDNFDETEIEAELKNYLPDRNVPARSAQKEVVIVEEEGEEKKERYLNAKKSMKTKKKKYSHTFSEEDREESSEKPSKMKFSQKGENFSQSSSFKKKKMKSKKQKKLIESDWKVSELRR